MGIGLKAKAVERERRFFYSYNVETLRITIDSSQEPTLVDYVILKMVLIFSNFDVNKQAKKIIWIINGRNRSLNSHGMNERGIKVTRKAEGRHLEDTFISGYGIRCHGKRKKKEQLPTLPSGPREQ